MVRLVNLLTVFVATTLLVLAGSSAVAQSSSSCPIAALNAGLCASSSNTGKEVAIKVEAEMHKPSAAKASRGSSRNSAARPLTAAQLQAMFDAVCVGDGTCSTTRGASVLNPLLVEQTPVPAEDADLQPARTVSVEDVARYVPIDAELRLEPDGWAVVGVPANFLASVSTHVVHAQLLGQDADVRFTPRLYRWNHGDGTSSTTASAGATWAALGQDDYSATPTSYIYRAKGSLDVSVTVIWSAEFRIADGPWTAIAGAVSSDSPAVPLLVVSERTVLTTG